MALGIHANSIIAVKGDDGVVQYSSAHIDVVESERAIHSGHFVQSNSETIEEVRRILLLHIAGE